MQPATAWDDDDHARGWTVMGRLADQQRSRHAEAARIRRERERESERHSTALMSAAASEEEARRTMLANWRGGPQVVALLFAPPDTDTFRSLDASGDIFNVRTGATWDMFFPGYHQAENDYLESQAGSRRVGHQFAHNWYFNANDFDRFRHRVEKASGGRWAYSGGADLVLVMAYMPDRGPIIIDWESTLAGPLTDVDGTQSLTVAQAVERLSRDLEHGIDDPHFGLAAIVDRMPAGTEHGTLKAFLVGVITAVAAQLTKDQLKI
jgi:hypothetical protein